MLIRNRNFVQSAELVCSQLLCTALISLSNYSFILTHYFRGDHGHPKHDLPAPRVSNSAEGCGEIAALPPIDHFLHRVLSASLIEAESSSRHWENEARGSAEKMARAEAERDAARPDALMARMDADAVGSTRAKVESKLARVQNALAVAEEARRKADDEVSCLTDEQISLLLELETCKDEMSTIRAEALRENEALREAYKEGFDVIFNYGYGCCAFAHNICGS